MSSLTRIAFNSPVLNVMSKAALKAARKLLRDFGEVENLQVSRKGPGDFVSIADKRAEATLQAELSHARPDYSFLMEESGEILNKDISRRWIIDPLDGTTNFLHGFPHFAISIALEEDGEVTAGLVYDPLRDELFYAAKGHGAYRDERRLRVSAREDLPTALMSASRPHPKQEGAKTFENELASLKTLSSQTAGSRNLGSAALDLCYIAAGRLDLYVGLSLAPWDMAAGLLIVKEAGGYVSDHKKGTDFFKTRSVIASCPGLHKPALSILCPSS